MFIDDTTTAKKGKHNSDQYPQRETEALETQKTKKQKKVKNKKTKFTKSNKFINKTKIE